MTGDPLPEADHVSRYCRPRLLEDGRPKPNAFLLRPGEDHLSVHWLEFLGAASHALAVEQVQATMTATGFSLARNGRFAVLQVGPAKRSVRDRTGLELALEHMPTDNDPAHAGIRGYAEADRAVAAHLAEIVADEDVYPARP